MYYPYANLVFSPNNRNFTCTENNPDEKSHMLTHENISSFKCNKCDKTFTKKLSLKRHLKGHTKKLRSLFKCHVCDKTFTEKSSLQRHLNGHTKKLQCTICSKVVPSPSMK